MKKTFVTVMPNDIGAFLKASRCFSDLGVNITRVSYNKAVDSHCLFIDAEGTAEKLRLAEEKLEETGYLKNNYSDKNVILIEFVLHDIPGSVTPLLEVIESFNLNISYISSQEDGTDFQHFRMGLITDDAEKINKFIVEAEKLCTVRVIEYNHADNIYDNSIFYNNFVSQLVSAMKLGSESEKQLLINVNLAMQELDLSGVSPYRTFDSISRFAQLLSQAKGEAFMPRITRSHITDKTEIVLIEPPCGSNTAVIMCENDFLLIDSGYACYKGEMYDILSNIIPGFEKREKKAFITHADVDHCGLLPFFNKVYASKRSAKCLRLECEEKGGFREQNRIHKPYITICKELTGYKTVPVSVIEEVGGEACDDCILECTGEFSFGDLHFDLYEGGGGHLKGESVLIDREHRIVFSGDILINIRNMTQRQAEYNRYAPILMTSVDTDPQLCRAERQALYEILGTGCWRIFGGHGAEIIYEKGN